MKRILSILPALALLAGCGAAVAPSTYTPVITIDPNTNIATSTPSTAVPGNDIFQQLASDIGVKYGKDATAFASLSGGMPIADPVGFTFATDLADLSQAIKATPNKDPLAQPGVLSTVEALRLQLMMLSQAGGNPLLLKTLQDGIAWGQSTKAMGLALPPEFMVLMNQIMATTIQTGGPSPLLPFGARPAVTGPALQRMVRPVAAAVKP